MMFRARGRLTSGEPGIDSLKFTLNDLGNRVALEIERWKTKESIV